jgi:hypothetical protein
MVLIQKHYNFSVKNILGKIRYGVHVFLVAVPFILWILPKTFFDGRADTCLSKLIFNMECYACGMTRAVMRLMHFDFSGAWAFNKISFIVLPLLGILWLQSVYIVLKKEPPAFLKKI